MSGQDAAHGREFDPIVKERRLWRAVIEAAKRTYHLNKHGVGQVHGRSHDPGECGLCDALRDLEEHDRSF